MVAVAALEKVPAKVGVRLHVADGRLDGGSPSELALDLSVYAAALTGEEQLQRLRGVVAAIALVGVDPLDLAAG